MRGIQKVMQVDPLSNDVNIFIVDCTNILCFKKCLILDMIIGQSFYIVSALTYLLETKIFSIFEYQLKCSSVADDTALDCCMIWSGAACCQQGHQRVAWTAAHLCES